MVKHPRNAELRSQLTLRGERLGRGAQTEESEGL